MASRRRVRWSLVRPASPQSGIKLPFFNLVDWYWRSQPVVQNRGLDNEDVGAALAAARTLRGLPEAVPLVYGARSLSHALSLSYTPTHIHTHTHTIEHTHTLSHTQFTPRHGNSAASRRRIRWSLVRPTSPQSVIRFLFSTSLIFTGGRRNMATCGTN